MTRRRRNDTGERRNPIQDAIAQRAYESYLDRGRVEGHALEDWLKAEDELAAAARKRVRPAEGKE
jgi:hypothetical protein